MALPGPRAVARALKGQTLKVAGRPGPGPSVLEGAPYSGLGGKQSEEGFWDGPWGYQSSGTCFGLAAGEEVLGQDSQEPNWLSGRPHGRQLKVSGPLDPSEKELN